MAPSIVVEDFDEVEDGRPQAVTRRPVVPIEGFGLKTRKKPSATALLAGMPHPSTSSLVGSHATFARFSPRSDIRWIVDAGLGVVRPASC